jgi:menaquinone-dependent protoporphyrinogen oxidase
MRILVAYASRRGATKGIAERIAVTLEAEGLDVTFKPFHEVRKAEEFDAFVLGSSAYMGHWEPDAAAFVRQHATELAARPVWLFSSGPVGTETVDKQGRDVVAASRPQEFSTFEALVHPRDMKIFFGAYDPAGEEASFLERLVTKVPVIRESMPAGDFRDWPEIEGWAQGIAFTLQPALATSAAG